ncbi:SDR family NAD(P)-dependent oxidoreductase [Gammaproteobacteria bacterium]|jgi:NAD(P)-dependent dehydrogenase (short-subunit alcohol dehydrogenase family)|nr:SDR family NAD(P)-dependent oxidoreductase [Gammaproteobacteria bacterium]
MIADVSTAVVTGGGHGIGRSLCRRLHRDGVRVVVVDIDAEAAARVAAEIDGVSICADVGDEVQVTEAIDTVEKDVGPIDLFISNAGVGFGDADDYAASAGGGMHSVADRWEACWRVNVMAHVYAARSLVPRMVARGGGYLVNVASAAGLLAQIGDAAYTATKHAAVGFAESLAITHGDNGVRVSVVCPQAVATRMIGIEDDSGSLEGGFGGNEIDGILSADEVADRVVAGVAEGRFLILTHPQVSTYVQRKAADHDRWISGMQRFRRRLGGDGQ